MQLPARTSQCNPAMHEQEENSSREDSTHGFAGVDALGSSAFFGSSFLAAAAAAVGDAALAAGLVGVAAAAGLFKHAGLSHVVTFVTCARHHVTHKPQGGMAAQARTRL